MKFPVREIPGFETRLRGWLPTVYHKSGPASDQPDAQVGALTLAHVLEKVVVALHHLAGVPVAFCKTAPTAEHGVFHVVVEYHEEDVAEWRSKRPSR